MVGVAQTPHRLGGRAPPQRRNKAEPQRTRHLVLPCSSCTTRACTAQPRHPPASAAPLPPTKSRTQCGWTPVPAAGAACSVGSRARCRGAAGRPLRAAAGSAPAVSVRGAPARGDAWRMQALPRRRGHGRPPQIGSQHLPCMPPCGWPERSLQQHKGTSSSHGVSPVSMSRVRRSQRSSPRITRFIKTMSSDNLPKTRPCAACVP